LQAVYAETTFICPSYWLAEGFTGKDKVAYKYQYSVPAALHGDDLSGYFGPAAPNQGPDFVRAFMAVWGNFIISNNPSISATLAAGSSNSTDSTSDASPNPISEWPAYTNAAPYQINLNETGGTEYSVQGLTLGDAKLNVTQYRGPGLRNDFTLVNARTWEAGRGIRCDFWRSLGPLVPE
jgi:hypothetical protein